MPMLGTASVRDLANAHALDVAVTDLAGNQVGGFDPSKPATATLTSVPTSTASATLLALAAGRHGFYVHNAASKSLYVAYAATASPTAFTFLVPPNTGYEGPLKGFTGVISGVLEAGSGNARVTELT